MLFFDCWLGIRKSIWPVKIEWWDAGMVVCLQQSAKCKWFAYGPAGATATQSSLASFESRLVLPFWCQLTQVVLEKRPLNECLSFLVTVLNSHFYVLQVVMCSGRIFFMLLRLYCVTFVLVYLDSLTWTLICWKQTVFPIPCTTRLQADL